MLRYITALLLALNLTACDPPAPPQQPPAEIAASPVTGVARVPGDDGRSWLALPVADVAYSGGCSAADDCVIVRDPCERAVSVHRDRQEALREQLAGRRYRCERVEYSREPQSACVEARCVAYLPGEGGGFGGLGAGDP